MKHLKTYEENVMNITDKYIIYTISEYNQVSKDISEKLILSELLSLHPVKVIMLEIETENPERIFSDTVTYSTTRMLNIIYSSNSLEDAKQTYEKFKIEYEKKWEIKQSTNKYNL